jgi:hypothetical protein
MFPMSDSRQVIGSGYDTDDHISAIPAVASIGTSAGDILLTSEAATASPAVAPFDVDRHTIDKHQKKSVVRGP